MHLIISEVVEFTSTIAHHFNSRGEAGPVFYRLFFIAEVCRIVFLPSFLRILMDQFMGFVATADKNTVTTNYTGVRGVSVLIRDEAYRHGSFIDIVV